MSNLLSSKPYSPATVTEGTTADTANEIVVDDLDVFPDATSDAPGVAVLSADAKFASDDPDDYETVTYTGKDSGDSKLTGVTRNVEGAARDPWPHETAIACLMTAEHFKRINSTVNDHLDNYDDPHEYEDISDHQDWDGVRYKLVVEEGQMYLEVTDS